MELTGILTSPAFRSSSRCVALLRYLIDHALEGNEGEIKERTLGVEVFGRDTGYDTATDSIVRRIANEVRKRLAQYYQEQSGLRPVKISLLRGSYLPKIDFIEEPQIVSVYGLPLATEKHSPLSTQKARNITRFFPTASRRRWALAIAAVLFVCTLGIQVRHQLPESAQRSFWKPLLNSNSEIRVCLPDEASGISAVINGVQLADDPAKSMSFHNARAGYSVTTLLTSSRKTTSLRPCSALRSQDFQNGPVVLIGGLDNPIVPNMLSNCRYSLHFDSATGDRWVQDAQNPTNRDWKIESRTSSDAYLNDYAVITRLFNPETKQWVIALSGLRSYGTQAAALLVTDQKFIHSIPSGVTAKRNFQIVLETPMADNFVLRSRPIKVLAFTAW